MRSRRTSKLVQFLGDEIESVWFTWFDVYINVSEAIGHHLLSHLGLVVIAVT